MSKTIVENLFPGCIRTRHLSKVHMLAWGKFKGELGACFGGLLSGSGQPGALLRGVTTRARLHRGDPPLTSGTVLIEAARVHGACGRSYL